MCVRVPHVRNFQAALAGLAKGYLKKPKSYPQYTHTRNPHYETRQTRPRAPDRRRPIFPRRPRRRLPQRSRLPPAGVAARRAAALGVLLRFRYARAHAAGGRIVALADCGAVQHRHRSRGGQDFHRAAPSLQNRQRRRLCRTAGGTAAR